jgi:heavy metal sensor kinase
LRRVPFRLRLTLSFAGVMVVLFGGLALLLQTLFSASLDQGIDRSLRTHSADLASLLRGTHELPALPESGGGAFGQVVDARTGRVLDATPGHAAVLLSRQQLRRAAVGSLVVAQAGDARLLASPVATDPPAVLVVGSSLAERNRALMTLNELLFIGGPAMLLLTCLAGYVLAARALAPVEKMRTHAARISGAPHSERLPVPEANDELHRLGETLNAMLSRLEAAFDRERAFVADTGHELRTPLSILKLELELALTSDDSRAELEARLRSAAEEVDRLARLADDLLVIARADQGRLTLQRRPVRVRQLLDTVAERFELSAGTRGREVVVECSERAVFEADPVRLEQAITNLVSNALRYGDGVIVVRAAERAGCVQIHVLDQGDGFDPGFLPRAFERFTRGDPGRVRGGAGLGLSIVRAIAEAHGGRVYAANCEVGADVWLSLPLRVGFTTSPDYRAKVGSAVSIGEQAAIPRA